MEKQKDILMLEECETIEELDDASFEAGFIVGVALVAGAVVLVTLT